MAEVNKSWEVVTIGDYDFSFEMLAPEVSFALSIRVVEAFGGIMASFIPLLGVDSEDFDIFNIDLNALNLSEIQDALLASAMLVDVKKIKPITDAVIPSVFVTSNLDQSDKGHRCSYEDFNGKIKTLYLVLFYALRWNYSDFFVESPLSGSTGQGAKDA